MLVTGDAYWDNIGNEDEGPISTPVKDFYKGKTVFLTGTTGNVGQLILQKLIRLDVHKIYVHIREKKGAKSTDRLKTLCQDVPMERAIRYDKNYMDKIQIIEGDLAVRNLGMSEIDIDEIINKVQIVFAVAADVRFNQPFRRAVNSNVRSIYDLLKIAERMQQLESFIFMSTAYSNNSRLGEEKLYHLPIDPEVLFNFVDKNEMCNDDVLEIVTEKLITPWCNTYTYTKNLAEYLVINYKDRLPVAVIRPSIIIGTDQDPVPGWFGNLFGANGIVFGFALGVLRIMFCTGSFAGDVIPGDYVSNSTLALAYFTHLDWLQKNNRAREPIYNCVSSTDNPITWDEMKKYIINGRKFATTHIVWHYTINYENNWTLFKLFNIMYHCIPAFFIDNYLAWRGDDVRLIRVYRTMFQNIRLISYFMINWKFDSTKMKTIYDRMTEDDHKVFPCDIRTLSWKDFYIRNVLGLRVWWLKDPLNTLKAGQEKALKLKVAHYILRTVYFSLLIYLGYKILQLCGAIDFVYSL